jgi:hypothetical protein
MNPLTARAGIGGIGGSAKHALDLEPQMKAIALAQKEYPDLGKTSVATI